MGKIKFSILFQKKRPIYSPGEAVVGNLNLKIKERLKINSVKVVISGYARVNWSESYKSGGGFSGDIETTHHYSGHEEFMNIPVVLIQEQPSSGLYLEVGNYSYPFHVVLPPYLPTSFEHEIGKIRYSVKGTIDIPGAFDKHSTKSFTVIKHLDLNLNRALRQPYGVSCSKVVCCCFCKSDPIEVQFDILKGGYVPGEAIVFNVKINNKSNRDIKSMSVTLVQKITFYAKDLFISKSKSIKTKKATINYPGIVGANSFEEWNNSALTIPSECSSSNCSCLIINVNYKLVFQFDVTGVLFGNKLSIPIEIGTIPIGQHFQANFYEAGMFGQNPTYIQEIDKDEIYDQTKY